MRKVRALGTPPAPVWYRELSPEQRKAFLATYFAWVIDAFDFTILTFVLVNIQQSFSVNAALAGLLGTVTLIFRVVGGIGAGTAAHRWGRKPPIIFSIIRFTAFALLSGLSTSYVIHSVGLLRRETLHLVADRRPKEPDLRWTAPQLPDATRSQSPPPSCGWSR